MIFPVKIYKPNEHGELEYVETIYPDALSKIHWNRFAQETGQLSLNSPYRYTRTDRTYDYTQVEE